METLGPEPRLDPESEGTSQTLCDPSKADGRESAGTLDGEGNGDSWRVGHKLSSIFRGLLLVGGRVITQVFAC